MFWITLLIIIYIMNIISILTLLFVDKKNISFTISWILVLTFIPIFGFILYIFLGSSYNLKFMSRTYSLKKVEQKYADMFGKHREILQTKELKEKDVILLNTNSSMSYFTNNNDVTLFTSAKDKFDKLFEDIKNAHETIHIEYFIIKSKDQIGKELIELLSQKAKENVKVKVIYDRFGCYKTRFKDFNPLIKNGGKVLRFLPSFIRSAINLNYRLHRKIVVIDNKIAYTGGINVGDEYLGKYKHITPWRDSAIRITGDSVNLLQLRFLYDWYYLIAQNKKTLNDFKIDEIIKKDYIVAKQKKQIGMQILSSGPDSDYEYIKDTYVKLVSDAQKYVYIQSPYLVPDETLLNTLRIAILCGIDVKIIIPGIPDKKAIYNITLSYAQDLINYGAHIYLYNGFIHAKSIVTDDYITTIGTCNMDVRSFSLNYEDNAILYDKEFAQQNRKVFEDDLKNCTELTQEQIDSKGKIFKMKQSLLRFISPLS